MIKPIIKKYPNSDLKRFARPIAFQNWPNDLLPEELKDGNPLGIWRTVNNELKK